MKVTKKEEVVHSRKSESFEKGNKQEAASQFKLNRSTISVKSEKSITISRKTVRNAAGANEQLLDSIVDVKEP